MIGFEITAKNRILNFRQMIEFSLPMNINLRQMLKQAYEYMRVQCWNENTCFVNKGWLIHSFLADVPNSSEISVWLLVQPQYAELCVRTRMDSANQPSVSGININKLLRSALPHFIVHFWNARFSFGSFCFHWNARRIILLFFNEHILRMTIKP